MPFDLNLLMGYEKNSCVHCELMKIVVQKLDFLEFSQIAFSFLL
jgi:thioredoxin-related protein